MSNVKVYEEITAQVLEQLAAGVVPWHRPWAVQGGGLPVSMSSRRPYRGVNVFLLACSAGAHGWTSSWWGTYRQIQELGGQVRKGEKSTLVVFWKRLRVEPSEAERAAGVKVKVVPMLRIFRVFNACQADGLPERFFPAAAEGSAFDPVAECEAIAAGYVDGPELRFEGDRACYVPQRDVVYVPERSAFESADGFYSTLFHELTHSSGHASRLARSTLLEAHRFGDASYSKEELVAEMGAAMLSGVAGIEQLTVPQNAAYLSGWMKALRGDSKLLVQAAAQAQKAADRILGVSFGDDVDQADEVAGVAS